MLRWTIGSLLTLFGCTPHPLSSGSQAVESAQVHEAAHGGVRLVRDGDAWFVAGLGPNAASIVEQGRLFAATRPLTGATAARPVAVLTALGPAVGDVVPVAPRCVVPEAALREGMDVVALSSGTEIKVGACLARVVEQGRSEHGEAYVVLNVGSGVGVLPGDQFVLLGRAVTASGFVPLGLDSAGDGLCQVPEDPLHLKISTARCAIIRTPGDAANLVNTYVVWMRDPS